MANVVSSTLANQPFFLQKNTGDGDPIYYSAADFRRMLTGIMPRSGILGSSHFLVTQADNVGMRIKVNSGYANVGGKYLAHLSEDQTIDLTGFDANPSTTRTHKVFLSIYDAQTKGTEYASRLDVVEDTGSGANPPANAAAFLQLATFTVAKNQGNVQNQHIVNTVRHGGIAAEYLYLDPYLAAGFTTAGNDLDAAEFRARYENGRVFLGGAIKRTGTDVFAAGTTYTIGTMHSNLRPARVRFLTVSCSDNTTAKTDATGPYVARLRIAADGQMRVSVPSTTAPKYLMFDGISYDLD